MATTSLSSNLHRLDPTTTKYTLIMADPDAPNSQTPILAPFLHWIVSDVQPDCVPGQVRNPSFLPPLLLQTKKKREPTSKLTPLLFLLPPETSHSSPIHVPHPSLPRASSLHISHLSPTAQLRSTCHAAESTWFASEISFAGLCQAE